MLAGRGEAPLAQTARLAGDGADTVVCPCDVTDPDAVAATFAHTDEGYRRLDLLFNNAGIGVPARPIDEIGVDEWQQVMEVNLNGASCHCGRASPSR